MKKLANSTCLITGADFEIGGILSLFFSREGASLMLTGTNKNRLEAHVKKIKAEGVLWGIPSPGCKYRYTYLSPYDVGKEYGRVLLEVTYEPKGPPDDNYGFNPPEGQECWQFSVFVPIPLDKIRSSAPRET